MYWSVWWSIWWSVFEQRVPAIITHGPAVHPVVSPLVQDRAVLHHRAGRIQEVQTGVWKHWIRLVLITGLYTDWCLETLDTVSITYWVVYRLVFGNTGYG